MRDRSLGMQALIAQRFGERTLAGCDGVGGADVGVRPRVVDGDAARGADGAVRAAGARRIAVTDAAAGFASP